MIVKRVLDFIRSRLFLSSSPGRRGVVLVTSSHLQSKSSIFHHEQQSGLYCLNICTDRQLLSAVTPTGMAPMLEALVWRPDLESLDTQAWSSAITASTPDIVS